MAELESKLEASEEQCELLRARHDSVNEQCETLADQKVQLERENKILRDENALLKRGLFGRSSERLEPGQLDIFGAESAAEPVEVPAAAPKPAAKKKRGHGRAPFSANLPREVIELDVAESDRVCSCCGKALKLIGEEATERGHIVPARLVVKRYLRPKYACPDGHEVKTASLPDGVIDGGKYEASVYAHVATAKYADHRVPRRRTQLPRGEQLESRRSESCCTNDEGGPFEIGVQAQVSNHLELRGSRARVVSVEGNGAARPRQVRSKETNASEPLMTCREVFTQRRNRAGWLARDKSRGHLSTDWMAFGMKAA